ncbi:MAG: hypothetical protein VX913_04590 [Planctomycetota bacterium]|nr:hypothetical protein [Planctomycetota bacterium]
MAGKPGGWGGSPNPYSQAEIGLSLFDLKNDIGEQHDVIGAHPEVAARLMKHVERARQDLGDKLTKRQGSGRRPVGRLGPDNKRLVW